MLRTAWCTSEGDISNPKSTSVGTKVSVRSVGMGITSQYSCTHHTPPQHKKLPGSSLPEPSFRSLHTPSPSVPHYAFPRHPSLTSSCTPPLPPPLSPLGFQQALNKSNDAGSGLVHNKQHRNATCTAFKNFRASLPPPHPLPKTPHWRPQYTCPCELMCYDSPRP